MQPTSQRDLQLLAAAHLGVPPRRLRAALSAGDGAQAASVDDAPFPALQAARSVALRTAAILAGRGARLIAMNDAGYPRQLLDLRDPPPFLIVRGTVPAPGIAIVGSRTPPASALAFAYELARRCGCPVVSGLAAGIDAAAHRGALDAGTPTIAYVAHGLGATFPREHAPLEERIVSACGAIASERLPGERALRWALVRRDRLQAAHARATVLVASEIDGGAMHTMRYARRLGRARYAVVPPDGEQGDARWSGNLRALSDGALALPSNPDEAMDILER